MKSQMLQLRAFSKRVIAMQPFHFTRVARNFLGALLLKKGIVK